MKNSKVTLESTVIEFNKWREKRKAGDPIPNQLWDMVAQIYDHYPHTMLRQKLNLKAAQLKSKGFMPNSPEQESQKPCAAQEQPQPPSPFVHVSPTVTQEADAEINADDKIDKSVITDKKATGLSPAQSASSLPPKSSVTAPEPKWPFIDIHRPDGVRIIFKHHDNAQLVTVLHQLINP